MSEPAENLFRALPSVDAVLNQPSVVAAVQLQGRDRVVGWVRTTLAEIRTELQTGQRNGQAATLAEEVIDRVVAKAEEAERAQLGPVINATGVILHTGLGRAPLSAAAVKALEGVAGAANVEVDLETTKRRYRGFQLHDAWKTLTGCEDAVIVNNNAAATLLTLQALCAGREVVISRSQLIEIGGSFRLPEIFELSGARLREVGTTNRTKLSDYEAAINENTAAIMRVHPSNYRIVGFTDVPELNEFVELARAKNVVLIDDVGSGCLVDVTQFGLPAEPTFPESIAAGADVVLGSGDKLLGGPQAGIILGRTDLIETIRHHPLARAVRVDKLTLGALSATLDAYLCGTQLEDIPVLRLLAASQDDLLQRAKVIRDDLQPGEGWHIEVQTATSLVGGGSLPAVELPTAVLSLRHDEVSADELARTLRLGNIRLYCRVHQDAVLVDLRSVLPEDDPRVALALADLNRTE